MSQLTLPHPEPATLTEAGGLPTTERTRPTLPTPAPVPAAADAPSCDEYPSSDGKPMAENTWQYDAMAYAGPALKTYFRSRRKDVFASGDLLFYYEEGNPRASVAPDVFVVFGVHGRRRMSYKVWEEGKGPDFVLEVASTSTWAEDKEAKPAVYARMGVREYFVFDPKALYLTPPLEGHRLVGREYERLPHVLSPEGRVTVRSETLGLEVWAKDTKLGFRDPVAGEELLDYEESHAARRREADARRAAESGARREADARRAAEVRNAELQAHVSELQAHVSELRVLLHRQDC